GPRRGHGPRLRAGVHAGDGARHPRRRPRHPRHRGDERDGHRAHRGGLRGGGDRRPRQHAGRPRGRARRRGPARCRHRCVPRARDAAHLPDCDRGAPRAPSRPVRGRQRMTGRFVLGALALAVLVLPAVAPPYYILLMLPFMAYAMVLLGLNLLFGYTGLVSFGHALFVGLGAYAGAVLTTHTRIRSLEVILAVAGVLGAAVAAPIGALCARYVKI